MSRLTLLLLALGLTMSACSSMQKTSVSRVPAAALIIGRDGGVILIHKSQGGMYTIKECQDFAPINKEQDCRVTPGSEIREVTKRQVVGEIARILQLPRFKPEIPDSILKSRRAEQAKLFRCVENLSMLKYEIFKRKRFGEQYGFFQKDLKNLEELTEKSQKVNCSNHGINTIQAEIDRVNAQLVADIVEVLDSDKIFTISSPNNSNSYHVSRPKIIEEQHANEDVTNPILEIKQDSPSIDLAAACRILKLSCDNYREISLPEGRLDSLYGSRFVIADQKEFEHFILLQEPMLLGKTGPYLGISSQEVPKSFEAKNPHGTFFAIETCKLGDQNISRWYMNFSHYRGSSWQSGVVKVYQDAQKNTLMVYTLSKNIVENHPLADRPEERSMIVRMKLSGDKESRDEAEVYFSDKLILKGHLKFLNDVFYSKVKKDGSCRPVNAPYF